MTGIVIDDPRVLSGMRAQLDARTARIAAGGKRLGWKAGFGAPAALDGFKLAGPLVGNMLQAGRLETGSTVSLKGWSKPVAEPEIALWFGADVTDPADTNAVKAAIKGISVAIELADVDAPPVDVAQILAGNIFHRHVILGLCNESRSGGLIDGLQCNVVRNGEELPSTSEVEAITGRILDVTSYSAATLLACGEAIKAGDVLICGSILPPLFLEPQDSVLEHNLSPVGSVSVQFSWE